MLEARSLRGQFEVASEDSLLSPEDGGAARCGGHDFYSMTNEMAGKCAFPPAAKGASVEDPGDLPGHW